MEIKITSDAWWETRVGESLEQFSLRKINNFFYLKDYGDNLEKIVLCFLCCNPKDYGILEQKVKFSKKERSITIFFVLDYDLFMKIDNMEREKIISKIVKNDVSEIIKQKLSKKFNFDEFVKDWEKAVQ